jgi:hypothetical protein
MKEFVIDVYKVLFRATRNKILSIVFAVTYISLLNMITIYGLCYLSDMFLPGIILRLYSFPYIYIYAMAMFFYIRSLLMPFKNLSRDKSARPVLSPLIIYSFVSLLLMFYVKIFTPPLNPCLR